MELPECEECRAILRDYRSAWRALAGEMGQSRLASDPEFRQDWLQARKLRTEEDVTLAEEVFPAIQFKSSPVVRLAIWRKFAHEARTGHKVELWRRRSAN